MQTYKYHIFSILFSLYLLFLVGCDVISDLNKTGSADKKEVVMDKESENNKNLPDVFILVIDSLRADHVGTYGYYRNTTPFIDSIAKKSLVFERAYAPSSFTRQSVSALFMGKYPSSTPWSTRWMAQPDPNVTTIAECFRSSGYLTFLYTDHAALVPEVYSRIFDFIEYYTDKYNKSGNGDKIVEKFINEVSKVDPNRPIFVYFHFYDPHHPYEPMPSYYLEFTDKIFPNPLRLGEDVRPNIPQLVKQGFGPGEERFDDLVLRYDAEILMVDDSVEKLYKNVSKLRQNRKAIWIITADHGEEFLDHGFVDHAWRLYIESIHVPFLFHLTSKELGGRRIWDEISLVDVYPSLVSFLKLSCNVDWDGIVLPLEEWIKGEEKKIDTNRIIVSELLIPTRNIGISLIKEGWQYLCWFRWLTVEQCSEYAKIQRNLRKIYEEGKLTYPKYCSDPIVHEEFISPDSRGYPKNFVSFNSNEQVFSELRAFREMWCTKRSNEKPFEEKMEFQNRNGNREGETTEHKSKSQNSDGTDFDPLRHTGYL